MSTCTKNLIAENGMMSGLGRGRIPTGNGYRLTAAANGEETLVKHIKNVALFFAAPFIGLAYLIAFPVVGFALLFWIAAKAIMKSNKARPFAIAIAAPLIALVFVTVGPIVALGGLAWTGAGTLLKV